MKLTTEQKSKIINTYKTSWKDAAIKELKWLGNYTSNISSWSGVGTKWSNVTPSWIQANSIPNWGKWETQWDYNADISKDKTRLREMAGNIKQYAQENPQLFKNYDTYKKYFHYDERSDSQKQVLDSAYKNYNKYWLNSNENKVADDASQLAADKGNERIKVALDWYNQRAANLKAVYDTMNPKYQWLIDKYNNLYDRAFKELDELKKLANEYYQHTKWMYDEQSAGEAAGVESRLSAQGLGYTAVGSATTGVGNQWATRYNNLMYNHLKTLRELTENWTPILTNILNSMWDLTDKQKWIVSDYLTWLNDLWNTVEKEQLAAVDWVYKPYEEITGKKVTGTAEKAWSQSEKDETEANYMAANTNSKVKILIDNLGVDENVKLTGDYASVLEQIAKQYPNDINKAISAAKAKFSTLNKTSWWTKPTTTTYKTIDEILAEFAKQWMTPTYNVVRQINPNIKQEEYEDAYFNYIMNQ